MIERFKFFCDSGANIHSCREVELTVKDLGLLPGEWERMDATTRDEITQDICFERLDYGVITYDEKGNEVYD